MMSSGTGTSESGAFTVTPLREKGSGRTIAGYFPCGGGKLPPSPRECTCVLCEISSAAYRIRLSPPIKRISSMPHLRTEFLYFRVSTIICNRPRSSDGIIRKFPLKMILKSCIMYSLEN